MSPSDAGERAPFRVTPLILHVLLSMADGHAHAYGMMKEIARRTGGRIEVGPGSMHFTLNRLLEADLIAEADGVEEDDGAAGARRRYYRLTEHGRSVLRAEVAALEEIVRLAHSKKLAPEG